MNAPLLAKTPNYNHWLATQERAVVDASEEAVGLTPAPEASKRAQISTGFLSAIELSRANPSHFTASGLSVISIPPWMDDVIKKRGRARRCHY